MAGHAVESQSVVTAAPATDPAARAPLLRRLSTLPVRGGYWFAVIAGVVSMLLTLGVWQWLASEQRQAISTEFGLQAEQRGEGVKREFSSETAVITALQAYFAGSDTIDGPRFKAFADTFLTNLTSIDSVQWAPYVPAAQRRGWEARGAHDVATGYRFSELTPQQDLAPVGQRDAYYPVYFSDSPLGGDDQAQGFDWGSDPSARAALAAARDTGETNAAAHTRAPGALDEEPRLVVFAPVYDRGAELQSVDERRAHLRGFVVAVIRIRDLIQQAIDLMPNHGVDLYLLDSAAPGGPQVIASILSPETRKTSPSRPRPAAPTMNAKLFHSGSLAIGERVFTLYSAATPDYGRGRWAMTGPTIALAGGLGVTAMLVIYLITLANQAARTERVVQLRTAELRRLNASLEERTLQLEISERDLRSAKDRAEDATHAKSQFLANMSHEIRTPMNGVLGAAELLGDTRLAAGQREYLQMITQSAENLLHLINDILDFSKIEAGRLELEDVAFDLRDELADALHTLAGRATDKGLELACHVALDVPDAIRGDPHRLRQVIINLVGNAIRFTNKGEVVVDAAVVTPGERQVRLRLAVTDTGPGVPPDKQKLIFEAFSQADTSFTRRFGGTGLGLTIASELVQLMGGQLELDSEVGKGSTFHFTAPFAVAEGAPHKAPAQSSLHGLPVLVVDDNDTNRRILEEMLRGWGMAPQTADGGAKALAALKNAASVGRPFRLVLLDMMMPDMDGFTVADQIDRDKELGEPALIMLSSAHKDESGRRGEASAAIRFILKPVRQSDLLEAIFAALGVTAESEPLPPPEPAAERSALRVLVAEDNAVNQRLAQRLLERRGHHVVIVGDGAQAIEALEHGTFDVVLMDVQMPGVDGFQATAAIREKEKRTGEHMPIVAMTAHAMRGDRERCLAAGMDSYVSKPLRADDFYAAVEGTLSSSHATPREQGEA